MLLSAPNAPDQEFHFDYQDSTMNKDPEKQPISLIVAIDPFSLNIMNELEEDGSWTISSQYIMKCGCIFFPNKVQHGGGKNNYQIDGKYANAVRLFAYMVSDEEDFPPDTVQYFAD